MNVRGRLQNRKCGIKELRNSSRNNQALCIVHTQTHQSADISDTKINKPTYVVLTQRRKNHGRVPMRIREYTTPLALLSNSSSVCCTFIVHLMQLDIVIQIMLEMCGKRPNIIGSTCYNILDGWHNVPTTRFPQANINSGMTQKEQNPAESLLELGNMIFKKQIILFPTKQKIS